MLSFEIIDSHQTEWIWLHCSSKEIAHIILLGIVPYYSIAKNTKHSLLLYLQSHSFYSQFPNLYMLYNEDIWGGGEKGELIELVLLGIWNLIEVAQHDNEIDAIQALDLLYRRVET